MQHQGNFREVVQRTSPHLEEPKRKKGQGKFLGLILTVECLDMQKVQEKGWIKQIPGQTRKCAVASRGSSILYALESREGLVLSLRVSTLDF